MPYTAVRSCKVLRSNNQVLNQNLMQAFTVCVQGRQNAWTSTGRCRCGGLNNRQSIESWLLHAYSSYTTLVCHQNHVLLAFSAMHQAKVTYRGLAGGAQLMQRSYSSCMTSCRCSHSNKQCKGMPCCDVFSCAGLNNE